MSERHPITRDQVINEVLEPRRPSRLLSRVVYASLLVVIVLSAIPYGTVQPWWRALFACAIFAIATIAIVEAMLTKQWRVELYFVTPLLLICLFGLFQSWSLFSGPPPIYPPGAVSADPNGTRAVVVELLALTVVLLLLLRYMSSSARRRALIYTIIGIGIATALFGILRKSFQHSPGFILPALPMDSRGFGQFINRNHFAYVMEMSLGLALGLLLPPTAGARWRRAILLPIAVLLFITLILSGSRGGILASLCQLLFLCVLVDPVRQLMRPHEDSRWPRLQAIAGGWMVRLFLLACLAGLFVYGLTWVGGESTITNLQNAGSDFTQQGMGNNDNASRQKIWGATWQLIKANPVAGVGLGGYWMAITRYHQASGELTPQQAHNDYLELMASVGLIGCALAAWFGVMLIKRARDTLRLADSFTRGSCFGALTGIAGVAVHSFVDFGLHLPINAVLFVCLVALTVQRPLPEDPPKAVA